MKKQHSFFYQSKVLGLSVAWHAIWFFSISTAIGPLFTINKERQATVFLGALLSKTDLLPKMQTDRIEPDRRADLLLNFQDKIETNNISRLVQSPHKPPIVSKDTISEFGFNDFHSNDIIDNALDKTDVLELYFNVDPNRHKFYRDRTILEFCEFRPVLEGNNFLWIERITSTGDPELDMDITRFIKEKLLNSPQRITDKIRVNVIR